MPATKNHYHILFLVFILILTSSCENKKIENSKKQFHTNSELNISEHSIKRGYELLVLKPDITLDSMKAVFKELAVLFTDKKTDNKKALEWYNQFIQHFEQTNNETGKGYLNLSVGKALCSHYDFENGIPYLHLSIENFTRAKDYPMLAKAYISLSLSYHDFGDYDKGITYANQVIKTFEDHPNTISKNMLWYAYNNLGINYDDDKQYEKAIESHLKALTYGINASDSSYSYNNLGNTYKKLKQFKQSEKYLNLSLKHSTDYDDIYHFATVYSNVLDIERINKNYQKANSLLDSAYYFAAKSKSPEKLIDFYNYAYLLKKETGNYPVAIEYLSQYITLKDSLLNAEKAKIVYDYQIKYETEKKEKQITEAKLVSKQKNIWLILLGSVVLIGLAIFRIYSIKSKSKQKQLALENELLKEHIHSKIQEQRLEISRDLHDSLGAQLTFVNSILDGLKNNASQLDDTTRSKINTLSDFSENSITELKNTLWVLNSKEIKLEDLRVRILNFIKNASEAKEDVKFNFDFDASENLKLNSKQAINLFRAIQEIINNALKYAGASEIDINIQQNSNQLAIKIADNGKGFDFQKEKNKSFGLQNIQSRITAINATINLETAIEKGTVYTIKIEL